MYLIFRTSNRLLGSMVISSTYADICAFLQNLNHWNSFHSCIRWDGWKNLNFTSQGQLFLQRLSTNPKSFNLLLELHLNHFFSSSASLAWPEDFSLFNPTDFSGIHVSSLRVRRVELNARYWSPLQTLKAPGNMMRSPAFSIIHKADNPQGLTTLVDAFHRRYKS